MGKIKTEAFQKMLVAELDGIPEGGGGIARAVAEDLSRLPVLPEDKARQLALVQELESISKGYEDLYRRRQKAIRMLKRLSPGQALMVNPYEP
jgi:hypothetical protein